MDGTAERSKSRASILLSTLPTNSKPPGESLPVSVGEAWRDVFIWNGTAYVGTPNELWDELTPLHGDVMSRAPLSFLDLQSTHIAAKFLSSVARPYRFSGTNSAKHRSGVGVVNFCANGPRLHFIAISEE
jgi:hypothetical protein